MLAKIIGVVGLFALLGVFLVKEIIVKDVSADTETPKVVVIVMGGPDDSTDFVVTWAPDSLRHRLTMSVDGIPHLNNGIYLADSLATTHTFRVGPVPATSSSSYIVGVQSDDQSTGMVSEFTRIYLVRNGSLYLPPVDTTSTVITINFPTSAFSIADSYVVMITEYDIMGNQLFTVPFMTVRSPADSIITAPQMTKGNRYQLSMRAYLGPIRSPIMNLGHLQFERQ